MDAPVVAHGLDQSVDGGLHLLVFAVGHEVTEERVVGLGGQLLQLRGGRGIPGLGLLRLRQVESLEEDLLQLLRGGKVQIRLPRQFAGGGDFLVKAGAVVVGELLQLRVVHSNARVFHGREVQGQRDFQVEVQLGLAGGLNLWGEGLHQFGDSLGALGAGGFVRQFVAHVALHHVRQAESAHVGAQQIRRQGRVMLNSVKL